MRQAWLLPGTSWLGDRQEVIIYEESSSCSVSDPLNGRRVFGSMLLPHQVGARGLFQTLTGK